MLIPYTMQRSGLLWQTKKSALKQIYTQGTSLSIVVDTETGVNYLVHDTGITPLLDKNGTVVITGNKQVNFILAAGYQHSNYE